MACEATTVYEAYEKIAIHELDVIFLDIHMPGGDGISFAHMLRDNENNTPIVFTTAYDRYAVKAFKVNALDYLLKPISLKELIRISEKLMAAHLEKTSPSSRSSNTSIIQHEKIKVPWQGGFKLIDTHELISIQSDNYYSDLTLKDKKITVTMTIGELDDALPQLLFFRVHNSYMINLQFIDTYSNNGGDHVILKNGNSFPIARRRVKEFKQAMAQLTY